jgi:DNA-binding MarR family transcriptional regulator
VAITDDGLALVDQFLPEVVALQTAVMAQLSEPQRRQLVKLLANVRDGLDGLDIDAVVRATPRRGKPSAT